MPVLSRDTFLGRCQAAINKTRKKGYQNHLQKIRKLIKNGIWQTLYSRPVSLEELKALSYGYNIPESTIRNWIHFLRLNNNGLPLHKRSAQANQITNQEEIIIAELIRQIIEEQNIQINNSLVRKVITSYYYKKNMDKVIQTDEEKKESILKIYLMHQVNGL